MSRELRRLALAPMLAACASAPAPDPAPDRCVLELGSRRDRTERRFEIEADGRGVLVVTRFLGYVPSAEAPRPFALDAGRFRALAPALLELPRAEHVAIGNLGADLTLTVVGADGASCHESYGSRAGALLSLCEELARHVGREHLAEVLEVPARSGATWSVARLGDPLPALRAALCSEHPDPDVERLAAKVAIERRAFELVPELHASFERSHARDPNGDYFQALVLLRLGDPIGVDAVLRIAQTPKPDLALPAVAAINASFAELLGKEPIPPHDFRSPKDPRPAAATALARFLAARAAPLGFDRERLVYR